VLATLALYAWCMGLHLAQQASPETASVSARWMTGGVSPSALYMQEARFKDDRLKGMPNTTLWRETPQQWISDGGEYNKTHAAVIELFGRMEDICRDKALIGGFPVAGDTTGCVLSERTAHDLWGSAKVTGMPVVWRGKTYYVYGVVKSGDSFMLIQTDTDDNTAYPYMQLRFPDALHGGNRELAERYLNAAGFLQGAELLDMPTLGWFMSFIGFMPALLLGASIIISIIKRLSAISAPVNKTAIAVFAVSAPALVVSALYLMGGAFADFPPYLIPPKWSDFDFFGELIVGSINHMKAWLLYPTGRDIALAFTVPAAMLLLLAACSLTVICITRVSIGTWRSCVLSILGVFTVMFAMAVLFNGNGGLRMHTTVWLMPCLWVVTNYMITVSISVWNAIARSGETCQSKE